MLALTVQNLGESTDSYTILPSGLTASWVTVTRGNLTLFGGSQEVVEISVAPPRLPTTTAGPTAVSIRIIPLGDADDAVVAEATVSIDEFDDCRLVPLQPVQRTRRRASYEFMVENHGNTVASCRLHLVDSTDRIDGDFDPPAVGVAPGSASLVRLKARAHHRAFRRSTRTLDFEIEASRQGHPPAAASLTLVQSPTIPAASLVRAAAVIALLAGLVLAWFGVVEPSIEEAVTDEVAQQVSELDTGSDTGSETGSTPPDGVSTTTLPDRDAPEAVVTTPGFYRLAAAAPLTNTIDQSITMPDGEIFDLTDVRIENPFDDSGVATLLVNSEPVFIWSLQNIRGSYFEPRITPFRLQPGDNVTFSVKCDEIGDPTRSTCTNFVNLGGEVSAVTDG